jgi:hypothetical protein
LKKVDDYIDKESYSFNSSSQKEVVPYSKLYSLSSRSDKTYMFLGWFGAIVAGAGVPSLCFAIGDVINALLSR